LDTIPAIMLCVDPSFENQMRLVDPAFVIFIVRWVFNAPRSNADIRELVLAF